MKDSVAGNPIAEALMQESIKGVEKAALCRAKPMCRGLFGPFGRHSLSELRLRRLSNVVKCSVEENQVTEALMPGGASKVGKGDTLCRAKPIRSFTDVPLGLLPKP